MYSNSKLTTVNLEYFQFRVFYIFYYLCFNYINTSIHQFLYKVVLKIPVDFEMGEKNMYIYTNQ